MTMLVAMTWNSSSPQVPGPAPVRATVLRLVDELALRMNAGGLKPVRLATCSWRRPEGMVSIADNDFLSAVTIEVEPGRIPETLRCWVQWQHPRWEWSREPFPSRLAIELNATKGDQHV